MHENKFRNKYFKTNIKNNYFKMFVFGWQDFQCFIYLFIFALCIFQG